MPQDPRPTDPLPGEVDEGPAVVYEDHADFDEDLLYELSRDK
jgi:hypothetical protein